MATHRARWRHLAGDPLALAPDGTVHCTQTADGEVEVVVGAARARLLVRCRPVTAFRASGIGSLRVQDDPVSFIVHPLGPDREPVLQIAGLAAVRDTSVVVLRDAALHVRRRGATSVDVHVGNCRWQEPVEVLEPVTSPEALEPFQLFEDSLTLVPGEIRTWRLRGNLYWFDLLADSASEATLQFGTTGFNCARAVCDRSASRASVAIRGVLCCAIRDGATSRCARPCVCACRRSRTPIRRRSGGGPPSPRPSACAATSRRVPVCGDTLPRGHAMRPRHRVAD